MPERHGAPGSATRRRRSPTWDRRTSGHPPCERRACSPSDWRRGWTGGSWTSSCTALTACTWRSSLPAWQPATETSRATETPSSQSSCVRSPTTPILGTTSSAVPRRTGGPRVPRTRGPLEGGLSGSAPVGPRSTACPPQGGVPPGLAKELGLLPQRQVRTPQPVVR